MATIMTTRYLGDHQVEILHGPTEKKIVTDLPPDNGGQGRDFSPTDLFAASLGSCFLTIMGVAAQRDNVSVEGMSVRVEKVMASSPRRISEIHLEITFPAHITAELRTKYLKYIQQCPVHNSLHPDLKVEIAIH